MTKRTADKSKSATSGAHPEVQRAPSQGAPGAESSKTQHSAKDARSNHDKDGNSQQRPR